MARDRAETRGHRREQSKRLDTWQVNAADKADKARRDRQK